MINKIESKKPKRINLLPNVITAFGLSCGLFVIFKMNMIEVGEASFQVLQATAGILLIAALADVLDGAVARVIKAESEFGGIFDCLADAISFGVAPSVIVLKSLSAVPGSPLSFLLTTAAIIFSLCGVLRLVRFSVSSLEAKGNEELLKANKKHFTGLPIPAAAGAAIAINLLLVSPEFQSLFAWSEMTRAGVVSFALIFLGYLMVSRWKFPSVKSLEFRVSSFQAVLLIVVSAVLILYGILHHFALILTILTWTYVMVALSLAVVRVIAGRKSKTLEEFEPEPDDLEENDLENP